MRRTLEISRPAHSVCLSAADDDDRTDGSEAAGRARE